MSTVEHKWTLAALAFALEAHGDQKRKYTWEPYIVHPVAVAQLVAQHGGTVNMIRAALLHDTIEDCDVHYDTLLRQFGADVAGMVLDLSDMQDEHDGNRAERKANECDRLSRVCANSQTIKVADLIDNTKSIVEEDRAFAPVYLAEKIALLKALARADPVLKTIAYEQIMDAQAKMMEECYER